MIQDPWIISDQDPVPAAHVEAAEARKTVQTETYTARTFCRGFATAEEDLAKIRRLFQICAGDAFQLLQFDCHVEGCPSRHASRWANS
jgi:hypothetical protein